jgi:MATE family multidrug resistance protein
MNNEQSNSLIDPSPVRELIRIALPSVVASTSYTVMQFVDKWVVSHIGPDPVYVGAQGSGGLAAWIPVSIAYGVISIVNTFVSQNMGAGKPERGPAYAWTGLWLGVVAWVLLIPYGLALPWLFELMGYEPRRVELASEYGQIMVFGSVLTICSRAIGHFFYGMQRPAVVMVAAVAGNLVNLLFNWLLIFGHWGFPALGLTGAAIATLIGTAVEALIPLALFLGPKLSVSLGTRRQWRPNLRLMRDILGLGWPAGLMYGSEMICWGFFMLYLVGSQGAEAGTAGFIAQQWMSLSFMPAVGIATAVASTVGKYVGMRRPDLAAKRAWVGLTIAMCYMGFCGVMFILFRVPMVDLFMPDETPDAARAMVLDLGGKFLIATAAFQLFDGMAMAIGGALRGAGDTHFLGVVTVVLSWSVMVGGGLAIVTYLPQWGSVGPWVAAASYIAILAVVSMARFLTGGWRRLSVVSAN